MKVPEWPCDQLIRLISHSHWWEVSDHHTDIFECLFFIRIIWPVICNLWCISRPNHIQLVPIGKWSKRNILCNSLARLKRLRQAHFLMNGNMYWMCIVVTICDNTWIMCDIVARKQTHISGISSLFTYGKNTSKERSDTIKPCFSVAAFTTLKTSKGAWTTIKTHG